MFNYSTYEEIQHKAFTKGVNKTFRVYRTLCTTQNKYLDSMTRKEKSEQVVFLKYPVMTEVVKEPERDIVHWHKQWKQYSSKLCETFSDNRF